MGLYEKMFKVMEESEAIEKAMTVGTGKNSYKAISEASVLNGVKPLLKEHRLILFPIEASIQEIQNDYTGYNGESKTRMISQVIAKYKIVDVDTGEHEILATVGNGADPQDKGSGKAWTYAYKALLQKTFMLFSGEDTDNTHSDDLDKPQQAKVTVKDIEETAKLVNVDIDFIIKSYNDKHKKNLTDLKFMPQENKQATLTWLKSKIK